MKAVTASIILACAHGAFAAPPPGTASPQFPGCQADTCYGGIDKAFNGDKALITAYCKLYSTSENFSQRFTDSIISDCAEKALDIDPSGAIRRPIRGKDIAKQCQCASGDDSSCQDDKCYKTMLGVFRRNKDQMSAYCSLKGTPDRGEIEDKLYGFSTCVKEFSASWGSGTEIDYPAIGTACDCVGRGD